MTEESSVLFRHRDRPGDPWLTWRGRGTVHATAPLLLFQTSGAQTSPFGPPGPPCHPRVAFIAFCAEAGGKSFGKSQGGSPPSHLWPKAFKVQRSPLVACDSVGFPSRANQAGPAVSRPRRGPWRAARSSGLGSVAPHSGAGQLSWVLKGVPAWGEAPRMSTPACSCLLWQILRALKRRRDGTRDSTQRGGTIECA